MISETLRFIANEVNKYLNQKLGVITDPRLVLGNLSKAMDSDVTGSNSLANKAILSLVNVEEDRVAKQQENFVKTEGSVIYKNPPLHLNLYIVLAVNRADYTESLRWLALIIQFFQYQKVFTQQTHPAMDPKIQKLMLDLQSMGFEQINHLWSILGGKYMPSILYKVRQVTIDEEAIIAGGGVITEITVNGRNKYEI